MQNDATVYRTNRPRNSSANLWPLTGDIFIRWPGFLQVHVSLQALVSCITAYLQLGILVCNDIHRLTSDWALAPQRTGIPLATASGSVVLSALKLLFIFLLRWFRLYLLSGKDQYVKFMEILIRGCAGWLIQVRLKSISYKIRTKVHWRAMMSICCQWQAIWLIRLIWIARVGMNHTYIWVGHANSFISIAFYRTGDDGEKGMAPPPNWCSHTCSWTWKSS